MTTAAALIALQGVVKDQGDRPTCVAFASTALHEFWLDIVSGGRSLIELDLSEEYLHFYAKARDGLRRADGTTVQAAASALTTDGQCLEELHPYAKQDGLLVVPSREAIGDGRLRTCDRLRQINADFPTALQHLTDGVPLLAVMWLYPGFYDPGSSGAIRIPGRNEQWRGRHAVVLVGVDQETAETDPSLTLRNSWGVGWGRSGYAMMNERSFAGHCEQLWTWLCKSGGRE